MENKFNAGNKKNKDDRIENLCELASSGRLAHSILLETEDVPKKGLKVALDISKALICRAEKDKPCNKCMACRKADSGSHPDIKVVTVKQGYKSIRVDDIRELRLDAYLSPNESEYKVYVISDGSLMNEQAQNVFLKILEEPPKNVKFIIICESRFSMLPTVRSRTQIFELGDERAVKSSAKIKEIVNEILTAVVAESDFELLKATASLAKNKDIFVKVIKEMEYIISNLCIMRAKGKKEENFENHEKMYSVSLERLLKIREEIVKTKNLINKNVNNQLVVCEFCIGLSN